MALAKEEAAREKERRQLEKEAIKGKKEKEKRKKIEDKEARTALALSKKRHKQMWSLKNVQALGDKLHAAIKENAPITGYKAPYCGFIPDICKRNQRLALERRRAKKKGQSTSHLLAMEEVFQ